MSNPETDEYGVPLEVKEQRYTRTAVGTYRRLKGGPIKDVREAVFQSMLSFLNPLDEELANKVLDKVMGKEKP